ncbi:MAG: protein kinase [Myxococcales bacterium]|nr:protein kinase [Myxococcales bacterium]
MSSVSRPTPPSDLGSEAGSAPSGTVVLVDTNPSSTELTTAGLRLAGYETVQFASLDELRLWLSHTDKALDAVVLECTNDLVMASDAAEVLDGFARVATVPRISIVGPDDPRPESTTSPHAHLTRPFAMPRLVQLIRQASGAVGSPGGTLPSRSALWAAGAPPTQVGGYELIAEIARGGMGAVFLGRRTGESGFRRLFAVKVMHPHLADQSEFITMLLDEARLASTLHHPNVVAVVDLGRDEVGLYLVMDYVEGCSLAQLLKRLQDQRPPELLVPLLVDTLQGLHAAHVQEDDAGEPLHLVHRDVSPQNILVGVDGVARIADFGIAKAQARLTTTDAGIRKGKLAYTAPEQLRDDTELDARADVFAAGAVMWSALTGRRLFGADNEAATILNVMSMSIPPPSTLGACPPACLDAICLKALERDRERRYASALEMANELRAVAMANGLWASPDQIGALVKETFADELDDRRRAVRLIAERAPVSSPSFSGIELMTPPSSTSMRAPAGDSMTHVAPSPPSPSPPERRRGLGPAAAALIALLLLGGGVGAWLALGGNTPAQTLSPPEPAAQGAPLEARGAAEPEPAMPNQDDAAAAPTPVATPEPDGDALVAEPGPDPNPDLDPDPDPDPAPDPDPDSAPDPAPDKDPPRAEPKPPPRPQPTAKKPPTPKSDKPSPPESKPTRPPSSKTTAGEIESNPYK